MSNRFFFWSLVAVSLFVLTISYFGNIGFSFFGILLVANRELSNAWIEKESKSLGLKVGYVELKGNEQY